ncbi:MAG: universal stress protein [Deltaproteobacteria bacterium]
MSNSMFNRILVAVDGSPASLHALKETFRLARAERGWVAAVSVVPPHDGELRLVGVSNIAELMRAPAEKALDDAARVAKQEGISLRTILLQGEPHEAIVTLAEEGGYDLIALGVKGYNLSDTVLMGSVTARVIGYGETNVLVIPRESRLNWQRILVPIDGSPSSRAAADIAFRLFDSYGSEVTFATVADVPSHLYGISAQAVDRILSESRQHLDEIRNEAASREIDAEYILREGEPAEILTEVAGKQESDLIVMGSHGRTGLTRLLMGSVTDRVIKNSGYPILVVRNALSSVATDGLVRKPGRFAADMQGV